MVRKLPKETTPAIRIDRRSLANGAYVSPVLLILIVVLVLPMAWSVVLSLQDYTLGEVARYIGIENYLTAISDSRFWNATWNTIKFIIVTVGAETVLGVGIALLLSRGFKLQKLWVALILAPYAVSPVVATVTWKFMLEPHLGIINYLLGLIGIEEPRWTTDPRFAFLSVALVEIWRQTPFMAIILYSAITSLPGELFEASRVDGASKLRTFTDITLPLIKPALLVGLVFRLMYSLRTFDVPWIMTQGGPYGSTELLSIYLYRYGFRYWDFGYAAAIGWLIMIITVLLSTPYFRNTARDLFGGAERE